MSSGCEPFPFGNGSLYTAPLLSSDGKRRHMAAAVLSRVSGRGGIGAAIVGVHVVLIYALCSWAPLRAALVEVPLEASIIDSPVVSEDVPPPPPQMVSAQIPVIDPPLI